MTTASSLPGFATGSVPQPASSSTALAANPVNRSICNRERLIIHLHPPHCRIPLESQSTDTGWPASLDIEKHFGKDVARLVDGVTKLSKIEQMPENERAAENLRKFLLAMSEDIRVLLVKLGDRLHNMRTLHFIKNPEKRQRISRETMDIYAPLAERIGLYEYMREMQMLAFEQLEPEAFRTITQRLDQIRSEDGGQVDAIALDMKHALAEAGITTEVSGREKHPYSIWRKMAERHVSFEQVTDIMAFRIICEEVSDCYRALGVLHTTWQFLPGKFKDYISTPKNNGYRSLHTSLIYG